MDVFALLDPRIRAALLKFGFSAPTEPQVQALPSILKGVNVLLIAPTGSGKTEAAVLPVFSRLLGMADRHGISVLYITPLRALNRDMLSRLVKWGGELGISVEVRHGDTTKPERARQSRHPPDFMITTPETLQIMLTGKRLRRHLGGVRFLIVDEVHELASSKRGAQLSIALERLVEVAGEYQRIGLSATVGTPTEVGKFLAGTDRNVSLFEVSVARSLEITVASPQPSKEDALLSKRLSCSPEVASHLRAIGDIVSSHRSTLIFVNTRESAEVLGSRFRLLEMPVGVHHGSLSRESRMEVEDLFKKNRLAGLICTSSMELGIDIGDIEHVVQYMSPREVARLIQRAGRAGHRIGAVSRGTIIAFGADDIAESWAIVSRAASGSIEPVALHENSADTLANQLCSMVLDFGELGLERAHAIIKRAYPFRHLTPEFLKSIVDQLSINGILAYSEGKLIRRAASLRYFYENISMIPDERRFDVYDIVQGKFIGALDEIFVAEFANEGAVFIAKGETWRILEIIPEKSLIKVEPAKAEGEIPSWVGEEIPVPFEVAQDVGAIRERIESRLRTGDRGDVMKWLSLEYPTTEPAAGQVVKLVEEQVRKGFPVPTHERIVIEASGTGVVLNVCGGHRVNETLGRVLSALLAARFGSSVAMEIDPYRIRLELPRQLPVEKLRQTILGLTPELIGPIIEKTMKNTSLFKWKMIHVARKFGAIKKDVDYERISLRKLLDVYEGTPMYAETLRELFQDRLDVERTKTMLAGFKNAVYVSRFTPIGEAGFAGGRELMAPERADSSIILALKNRIMADRIILFCVHCRKWVSRRTVANVPDVPECPVCGSRMIAALKPWEEEDIELVRKAGQKGKPDESVRRVFRNASLVLSHGKTAVIALASRGIGPETASRVIRKMHADEEGFYREILSAERNYVKTKRFWD